ncbi:MAG TPA: tetratricopeptide repeat protein [Kofleriaceae bacterium]|nr:tetratricopeptide repeat protein [Kofleriaceae bacterium]
MPPTSLCIVARSMSRFRERARIASVMSVVLVSSVALGSIVSLTGCEQLDGRNRTRKGNRLFRETQFVESAAEYERALKEVDDPVIHYNLGLAYSKLTKPGDQLPVLLGTEGESVCSAIPGTKTVKTGACVKEGDRHFADCGSAHTDPIDKQVADLEAQLKAETDDQKKKDLESQIKEKQDEKNRYVCPSSFRCVEGNFCAMTSPELAELAAKNFQAWIKAQPTDEAIRKELAGAEKELDEAKKSDNKSAMSAAQKTVDDLGTKDQTRKLMTQLWIDTEQYAKALEYWQSLLGERPNDPEIMGNVAGINLKAGDWRKAIEWYNKVADATTDPSSKVAAYKFIGNVAWSKLNSRTLPGAESVELADRGIGALQRAAEVQPKNFQVVGLSASLFNFRSTAHGASWAGAIDRATTQDLQKAARVLSDEAKKAQGLPVTPPTDAPGAGSAAGSAAPAAGSAAGSAAPAAGSAAPAAAGSAAPASGSATPASTPPAPEGGGSAVKSGG